MCHTNDDNIKDRKEQINVDIFIMQTVEEDLW